ncbi:unnamed protein product [Schistosoma curassoni]|uniref:Uncharacterized protein n=1 Tax=Schistosoma curassoni TaxID=6186 RepID=A0A183JPX9_9TREM|nr:unnamed protein product [Schistosoma curassoni]
MIYLPDRTFNVINSIGLNFVLTSSVKKVEIQVQNVCAQT